MATRRPPSAHRPAAFSPGGPAPITMTSKLSLMRCLQSGRPGDSFAPEPSGANHGASTRRHILGYRYGPDDRRRRMAIVIDWGDLAVVLFAAFFGLVSLALAFLLG